MSSSIPTASYTALQEKDEIRLLHLQPGTEASPIICNIHHIQLSQEPRYEALSYQWGSEAPLKTIELNNQPRYVRSNLYFALQHLRRRRKARVLWVDALCINQENDVERSHQVFQMGSIYSHARQVCVWLGLADTCAYGVARLLRRKELSEEVKQGIIRRPEEWYDMAEFCKREYWDRLWIIQEVELA
ncbi:HET-domain-containing protein, partial [Stipitochalara longipes BDJ]